MRSLFALIFFVFFAATAHAEQICKPDSISATTPDSQLLDNGNNTISDLKTGLMWKKCLEGVSGRFCDTNDPDSFTWQQAIEHVRIVNKLGGSAGHDDWRMPTVRELISIVEEQCYAPAVNQNRFPNTPSSSVWSRSPYAGSENYAWLVNFGNGGSRNLNRGYDRYVRLVRGGHYRVMQAESSITVHQEDGVTVTKEVTPQEGEIDLKPTYPPVSLPPSSGVINSAPASPPVSLPPSSGVINSAPASPPVSLPPNAGEIDSEPASPPVSLPPNAGVIDSEPASSSVPQDQNQ
jgi:hypothetical protein